MPLLISDQRRAAPILTPAEKRRKIKARTKQITSGRIPISGVSPSTKLSESERFGIRGNWQNRPLTPAEAAYQLPETEAITTKPKKVSPVKAEERKRPRGVYTGKHTPLPKELGSVDTSQFRRGMDTVSQRLAAETPTPVQRSFLFNRAKENIQRQNEGPSFPDTFGSPYVKDPVTGKNIPTEGYYNEAGTFIRGPRVKAWEPLRAARTPKEREIAMGGYAARAGKLDPETGRVGEELARRGEQTLSHIRGRYLENIARKRGEHGVEEARIMSEGKTGAPLKPYTGTLKQTDEETGFEHQIPYNEYTGQPAPGYDSMASAELPAHIKKIVDQKKKGSEKAFKDWYMMVKDKSLRKRIRAYAEGQAP